MPARWTALVVCSLVVGAPPLEVSPPLVADFDEWEVYQAHSVVQAAKDAKRYYSRYQCCFHFFYKLGTLTPCGRRTTSPCLYQYINQIVAARLRHCAPHSLIDLRTGLTLMQCGSRSNTTART